MLALYGSMWQFGDPPGRLVVPCPVDAYVAPRHRRRGLYRRLFTASLALAREHGWDYAFSLGSEKPTYACNVQLGSRSLPYRLPSMHWRPSSSAAGPGSSVLTVPQRVLHSARRRAISTTERRPVLQHALRSVYGRIVSATVSRRDAFELLDAGVAAGGATSTGIEVTSTPRPEAMAVLAESVRADGRIRHVKDATYLSWRFRRQYARYRFLFLGADELEGYVVLQSWARRGAHVSVVDWEVAHPDLLADLMRAAMRLGQLPFVWIPWVGWPSSTADALERIGFVFEDADASSVEDERPFTVEVNLLRGSSDGEWMLGDRRLLDPLDWDLRLLYADFV